jgi:hypothetical protein
MPNKWNEKEVKILKELCGKGISAREIAEVLKDRTMDSIVAKMRKVGISCIAPEPSIDYDKLRKLMKETK